MTHSLVELHLHCMMQTYRHVSPARHILALICICSLILSPLLSVSRCRCHCLSCFAPRYITINVWYIFKIAIVIHTPDRTHCMWKSHFCCRWCWSSSSSSFSSSDDVIRCQYGMISSKFKTKNEKQKQNKPGEQKTKLAHHLW